MKDMTCLLVVGIGNSFMAATLDSCGFNKLFSIVKPNQSMGVSAPKAH